MVDEAQLASLLTQVDSESGALDALLKSMLDDATLTQIKDSSIEDVESVEAGTRKFTKIGDQAVKAVFVIDDLRIIESAIRAASRVGHGPNGPAERDRGRALLLICEAYIAAEVKIGEIPSER